jgi:hypothetical protein
MKRPPRPTGRPGSSPGWTIRRRQYHGRDRRAAAAPLTPTSLGIEPDHEIDEQISRLHHLELENLRDGADLRSETYAIARHPELRLRLEQSDELVDTLPGHVRLRAKRRRGILRYLSNEPDFAGLPFFLPLVPPMPTGAEWPNLRFDLHLGRLVDELEHLWFPIVYTSYGWRPTSKVMNSVQMRGVLSVNASSFYELNRKTLIPGRLLPDSRYDTETVMRWMLRSGYLLFTVPITNA